MTTASTTTSVETAKDVALPRARERSSGRVVARILKRALSKGALSVFDQAVVSGTSFLTTVFVGRACSQQDLGVFYLAMSIVLFVRAVQSDVVSAPYMIYCHRHRGRSLAKYSGSSLVHQLLLSMLTLLGLTVLLGLSHGGLAPAALLPTVQVMLGVVPFLLLREFIRNFAFSHLRMAVAVGMDLFVATVQLSSLAWLALSGELTVERVYLVMGVACALACSGWFIAKRPPLRFDPRRVWTDWRANWVFAKWALAGQLVGRAAGYVMPWIIAVLHGEAATGILAACITLVNMAGMFVTGMSNFLTPRSAKAFASGGLPELRGVLAKAATVYAATIGLFFLVMTVAGEHVATLVYGSGFEGAGPLLAILAFGMLANSLGLTAGNGLWALDRAKSNFKADLANLIITFGVLVCCVGPLGVLGAALATTAGFVVGAVVRWLTLLRIMAEIRGEQTAVAPTQS